MPHKNYRKKEFKNIHFYCFPKKKALILKWKQAPGKSIFIMTTPNSNNRGNMVAHGVTFLLAVRIKVSSGFKKWTCMEKWASIAREFHDLKVVVNKTLQAVKWKWKVINKPFEFDSVWFMRQSLLRNYFLTIWLISLYLV